MKVFYANAASTSPQAIEQDALTLKEALELKSGGSKNFRVRSGRSDHHINFRGDWEAWQNGIIKRKHLTTGKPLYAMFVVSGTHCGRATATILHLALQMRRPVFWWNGQNPGTFHRVTGIREEDCEDWTNGWSITYALPTEQLPLPFPKEASQ